MDLAGFGLFFVIFLRLTVPLLIFRWPLWGTLASAVVDALDTNLVKPFGAEIPHYVQVDKVLDLYYLSIAFYVSLKWENKLAKRTSIFLYVWRLVGVILFELSGIRYLLFIFPNLFENFFIFFEVLRKLKKDSWISNYKRLGLAVFLLWLLKVPQELILHVYQVGTPVETFYAWLKSLF
ncbi:MAG TPA: hypothetical protein VLE47_01185 [Candidatus Saccharimonadales bacterium]|nr:hypothetical protein [Candidatus Saccharimonadales bacterium]